MRKIGISLATLLTVALSACTQSPTASAAGADASLSGGWVGSGSYEEEAVATGWDEIATAGEADAMTTEAARNPGLGLTGN